MNVDILNALASCALYVAGGIMIGFGFGVKFTINVFNQQERKRKGQTER